MSFKSASLIVQVSDFLLNRDFNIYFNKIKDLVDHTESSLKITKQRVLSSHHLYDETLQKGEREVVKLQGKGWDIKDLFKEYYVIHEEKYHELPKYSELKFDDLEYQTILDKVKCFAFINGVSECVLTATIKNIGCYRL